MSRVSDYWKCNSPMTRSVRRLAGCWSNHFKFQKYILYLLFCCRTLTTVIWASTCSPSPCPTASTSSGSYPSTSSSPSAKSCSPSPVSSSPTARYVDRAGYIAGYINVRMNQLPEVRVPVSGNRLY